MGGALSYDFITENLSLVGEEFLKHFIENIVSQNRDSTLEHLQTLKLRSVDPRRFVEEFLFALRDRLMTEKESATFQRLHSIFSSFSSAYARLRDFPDGFLLIEITTLSCLGVGNTTPERAPPSVTVKPEKSPIPPPAPPEESVTQDIPK